MEQDVVDFIQELIPDKQIIRNDRSIISPLELDIWLPDYNIGIEVNPTSTHNSSGLLYPGLRKDYHVEKSLLVKDNNIQLLHIFGHHWTNKRDIVKSMIRNLFKLNINKYYARSLEVRTVTSDDSLNFLKNNHIQGATTGSVRLGLYTDSDILISLMVFSHPRGTIGHRIGKAKGSIDTCRDMITYAIKTNSNYLGYRYRRPI